ncbi:MAG: hypothetical protein K2L21_03745 [Muribaculaceae bacterium]|nr:hypothetical protein [Muribaculaceae bacterium]
MTINLLWTGGLDSTFRLVELAHEDVEIRPFYIVDTTRGSIRQEMNAMAKILYLLRQKTFVKAVVRDIEFIHDTDIRPDKQITDAHSFFVAYNNLGSQYDYLARFARQNNLKLEIGLEGNQLSKVTSVLNNFGSLSVASYTHPASSPDHPLTYFYVDALKSHNNTAVLFRDLIFPAHLFSLQKVDEAKILKDWGCMDIMKATWFCHRPILGYPCGHCNPCKDALNEGMSWRVPMTGRLLYSAKRLLSRIYGRIRNIRAGK